MYQDLETALIGDKKISEYVPDRSTLSKYLDYLKTRYEFGTDALATPDRNKARETIFNIAIRPILQHSVDESDIDLYSDLDHSLFQTYICPIEDIDWFSKAFWDVNSYGLTLARKLSQYLKTKKDITRISGSQRKNILFVFKGPFSLAHSNVLNDLLNGSIEACQNTDIYLLLLDNPAIQIPNVKVFSFANLSLTSHKIDKFIALTRKVAFHNIVWVACIQNLALYMGIDLSRHSTYWTMKRHSIVFPEINRYATFISQHRNTNYNGAFWYGGRYRLKVVPTIKDKISIISQVQNINDKTKSLFIDSTIFGSLARSQKYQNLQYWQGIERLLSRCPSSIFVYGTSQLPEGVRSFINNSQMLKKRSFNFGWLKGNTADIASLIDIYVDTIPFGSGLTAAECILSNGCYLGTISHINKEASFTNILTDALNLVNDNKVPYNSNIPDCGLFVDFNECIDHASSLYNDNQKKLNLRNVQVKLLKNLDKLGSEHFSKDYLQFFSR